MHAGLSDHNVDSFHDPYEDVLLHVGHAILLANRPGLRRAFLVGAHGQIGPAVVLDLVVEEALAEVDEVGAVGKVHGRKDLSQQEASAVGLAAVPEPVEVIPGVVGNNGDEGVGVREELREEKVLDTRPVHAVNVGVAEVVGNADQEQGHDEEVNEKVGAGDNREELAQGEERRVASEQNLNRHRVGGVHIGGDLDVLSPHSCQLELLVGIGSVVGPLPRDDVGGDDEVLDPVGRIELADVLEVVLHEVRVIEL